MRYLNSEWKVLSFSTQVNTGKVIAVGPGGRGPDGKLIPVVVKEGDTVLLPEYGGNQMKLGEEEYVSLSSLVNSSITERTLH
mgnify:FL=1